MTEGARPLRASPALAVAALLLCGPAAAGAVRLYANLRPELDELLPEGSPAVRGARTLRARMAGAQHLGVVVRGAIAGPPAAFAAALADRLRAVAAERPDLVRGVHADVARERAFLARRGGLYLPLADLRAVADRLAARVRHEAARANPFFVPLDDPAAPPPVDLRDIEARARGADPFAGRFPGDRLVSNDGLTAVVLVLLATVEAGARDLQPIIGRVAREVAALHPARSGLAVGYAGDAAIAVEELSALESDIAVSALLVLGGVGLSVLLAFRWWRAIPLLAVPLAAGTLWGFGLASLVIPSLGASTAFLGSIVVGNGVNPGIMLLARHLEERRRGAPVDLAVARAVAGTWRGTLAAAVAAAAGYASLATTSFRGFSELGVIGAAGMLTCWLATYVLGPPLIARFDRGRADAAGRARPRPRRDAPAPTAPWIARHARLALAASLVPLAAAAALATRLDGGRIEYDMSKLRLRDSFVSGEAYFSRYMNDVLGRNFTAVAFMTDTEEDAARVAAVLAARAGRGPLARVSSRLLAPADLVPPDQHDKRAVLDRIRGLLTPAVAASLEPADRAALDRLVAAAAGPPLEAAELPELLAHGLRERDGRFGRTVLLLQSLDRATWDGALTIRAAAALDEVARHVSPPAAVAGGFVVSASILDTLGREALPATGAALGAVAVVVLILLRARREALLVLAAVLAGSALLAGAVVALDLRLNFLSLVAFPITFGIGAEYALNVLARHRQRPGDPAAALAATGGAVALCSLTTIIGYGSLLLARNQALASFGLLAVLGEIFCLLVAVIALPAYLSLPRRPA
jgi:hypothetical protein